METIIVASVLLSALWWAIGFWLFLRSHTSDQDATLGDVLFLAFCAIIGPFALLAVWDELVPEIVVFKKRQTAPEDAETERWERDKEKNWDSDTL